MKWRRRFPDLWLKKLWLQHTYRFRWAHKPLCQRFQHDVLSLGHVYLCRSCTFVWAGLVSSAVALLLLRESFEPVSASFFAAVAAPTLLLSLPRWYSRWPRRVRDLLRFGLGVTLASGLFLLATGQLLAAALGFALLYAVKRHYQVRRRAKKKEACRGCPELGGGNICSGFALQAQHVRRYEAAATVFASTAPPAEWGWSQRRR